MTAERPKPAFPKRPSPKRGRRLAGRDRETEIVRGATAFFSERGFSGQTRDLATALGISIGLLYKHFPSKEALIDRVYDEVLTARWNPDWDRLLADRTRPITERLGEFYVSYGALLRDRDWVRIYLHSGLAGERIALRFIRRVVDTIFVRVIGELRHEFAAPSLLEVPITESEIELMWSLHSSIFYLGVRRWVYMLPIPEDADAVVLNLLRANIDTARTIIAGLAAPPSDAAS
jgi:AcrR family transcriptional regulator